MRRKGLHQSFGLGRVPWHQETQVRMLPMLCCASHWNAALVHSVCVTGNADLVIAALVPLNHVHISYYTGRMVQAVISVFEEDINKNPQILPGHKMAVISGNSGGDEPHVALSTATRLYSEAKAGDGALVGWLGPYSSPSCTATQTLIQGLNQPQISYGCTSTDLSSKKEFPVC